MRLHELLQQSAQVSIASIQGMGGIGKTELALQYALHHYNQQTYFGGVCWLRARDQQIGTQILQFARSLLDLTLPESPDLVTLVQWCWRNWRSGDVLVVVDDVTEYADIRDYLPPTADRRFRVLLTTRSHFGAPIRELDIAVLQPEEAIALLASLVGDGRVLEQYPDAEALCERLGYLPLGVELVGRYLASKRDVSIAEMGRRLEQKQLQQKALQTAGATMTAQRGVAAAFELSWLELDGEARRLGGLLSLFALAPIPWSIVEDCWGDGDGEELEEARDRLVGLHLLTRVAAGLYQLHPLVRQFLAEKLKTEAGAEAMRGAVAAVAAKIARGIPQALTRADVAKVAMAIPHLQNVASHQLGAVVDDDSLWIFVGIARFYKGQGIYAQAEPWYQGCLSATKERLGDRHPAVATSLNNLAFLYYSQGRYEEAEPFYVEAMQLRKDLLGDRHPDVAQSLNNLAGLYKSQGRYEEAEPLYVEALQLRKELLGDRHPDVATSLNNLALLYKSQGRYEEAEPLYVEALQLSKDLLGDRHPDVATSLNNLAGLYDSQGRYDEAEPLYVEALQLYKDLLGDRHPDVALSLNNLAYLYDSQGRYDEAEPLYVEALQLYKDLLGDRHPDVASSLNNLAVLYDSQGRYDEAEPLYIEALQLRKDLLGDRHSNVATSLNNLAALYKSQGRYEEAEPLYLQALQLRQEILGDRHPNVATSLNNLAALYRSQGRYEEAEPLYLQALQLRQEILGDRHPNVASSLNNLAFLYDSQGRYEEAEPLYLQALQLGKDLLGDRHPNVATSLNNLGVFYFYQNRFTESESLLLQALEIRQQVLGNAHPDTIGTQQSLINLRQAMNL
jgi:tetratricopeptide (TPR) repeat protein